MTNWQRDESEYWPDHIEIPKNDWLFTKEQLADSVSVRAGLSRKDEFAKMEKMYRFMREIGGHEPVMFFAVIYLQRYFQRVPVTQGNPYHICVVMIFLASRVLEQHRPGPELALKGAKVALGNQQISKQSKDFWIWRDELVKNEMLVMDKLCCDFILYNPWEELKRILVKNRNNENEINKEDPDVEDFWKSMHQEVPLPAHALRLMGRIAYTQVYLVFRIQDVLIAMMIASAIHYKLKWPKHFFMARGIKVNIATLMKIYKFVHREQNAEIRKSDYQGFCLTQDDIKRACNEEFEGLDDILDSGVSTPSRLRIDNSDDVSSTLSSTRVSQEPRDSTRPESSRKLIDNESPKTPFKMTITSSTAVTPTSLNEERMKATDLAQAHIGSKDSRQKDSARAHDVSNPGQKSSDSLVEDESQIAMKELNNLGQDSAQIVAKVNPKVTCESNNQGATIQQVVVDKLKNDKSVYQIGLGDPDQNKTVGQRLDDICTKDGTETISKEHDAANCEENGEFHAEYSNEEAGSAKYIPSEVEKEHRDVTNDGESSLDTKGMHRPQVNAASSHWQPPSSQSLRAVQGIPHQIAPLPKMKERPKAFTNNPARENIEVASIQKSKRTSLTLSERRQFEKPSAENPLTDKSTSCGSALQGESGLSLNTRSPSAEHPRDPHSSSIEKRKRLSSDIQDPERLKKSSTERPLISLCSTTLETIAEPYNSKSQLLNEVSLDSRKNSSSQSQGPSQKVTEEAHSGSAARTKTSGTKKGTNVVVPAVTADVVKANKVKKEQQSAERERKRRLEVLIGYIDKLGGHLNDLK